jgi:hypothetical protein
MKRQLLFAALLVIGFNASAQFTKGEKVLSGNISFNTGKTVNIASASVQESASTNFALNTGIGWVKSEKRISGFRVGYFSLLQKSNNGADMNTNNGINLGAFNQHIKNLNKNIFGFLETNINGGYSWGKYTNTASSAPIFKSKGYNINSNANIGIGYRITKQFIADATLVNILAIGYSYYGPEADVPVVQSSKTSNFNISTGLSSISLNNVSIGFRYVFQ